MEHYERELLPELVKWLDKREILAIKAPRQSGKTTLLEITSPRSILGWIKLHQRRISCLIV